MKAQIECTVHLDGEDYDISCTVYREPGCRTMSNGDPGWPPESEVEVHTITDSDGISVRDRYRNDDKFADAIDELIWDKL